jgi:hypothetical protein
VNCKDIYVICIIDFPCFDNVYVHEFLIGFSRTLLNFACSRGAVFKVGQRCVCASTGLYSLRNSY